MARLNPRAPSRKSPVIALSPPPPEQSETDSANVQLEAEARIAKSSGPQNPPNLVAAANLLNTARASAMRASEASSPILSSPPPENIVVAAPQSILEGTKSHRLKKIKRTTIIPTGDAAWFDLRAAPRKDVYDISVESPQKGYRLPEERNHNPLKVTKKNNRKEGLAKAAEEKPRKDKTVGRSTSRSGHDYETGKRVSSRLAGQEADVKDISWDQIPEAATKSRPKRKPDAELPETRPTKTQRIEREPSDPTTLAEKSRARGRLRKGNIALQHVPEIEDQAQGLSDDSEVGEPQGVSEDTSHSKVLQKKAARQNSTPNSSKAIAPQASQPKRNQAGTQNGALPTQPDPVVSSKSQPHIELIEASSSESECQSADENSGKVDDVEENLFVSDYENDEPDQAEDEEQEDGMEAGFEFVFEYIHSIDRPGQCETELGKTLKQSCKSLCRKIEKEELEVTEMKEHLEALCTELTAVDSCEDKEEQGLFKADAYGQLFSSFAHVLVDVHDWARIQYDEIRDSAPALRLLITLGDSIISFRDTITSWNVDIAAQPKGSRPINNVIQHFISPLRRTLLPQLRKALSHVEEEYRIVQQRSAQVLKLSQQRVERRRKLEAEKERAERWAYWQHLHTKRQLWLKTMDRERRAHFHMRPLVDLVEERDANGVRFEREPFFRARSTPFTHRGASETVEFSPEQLDALVEGLERFAGPRVFEHIFKRYCQAGGILEDFNVEEITSQAAEFRAVILESGETSGYDVPGWIREIPVLP